MSRALIPVMLLLSLSACDQSLEVNPPTEPAAPMDTPLAAPQGEAGTLTLPGRGPASFVGRWAADVQWCAAPRDVRRPIEITPTRLEGYENSCAIAAVDETADGYVAQLQCLTDGVAHSERVKMAVSADVMKLTWLDRENLTTTLHQCTTLADTAEGVIEPSIAPPAG